MHVPLITTWI